MTDSRKLGAVAMATLTLGLAACGGDSSEKTTASAADAKMELNPVNVDRFLMQKGEEPGFRQGAAPGAMPESRETIKGVDAFVQELGLPPTDADRLRDEGFISFTVTPIRRGTRTAGLSNVSLYASAEGARSSLAHELDPDTIRSGGQIKNLKFFPVPGVPGARGWTGSVGMPHDVGNVYWAQGRCMLTLGNQGPGRLSDALSTGAKAIYERTNGECP